MQYRQLALTALLLATFNAAVHAQTEDRPAVASAPGKGAQAALHDFANARPKPLPTSVAYSAEKARVDAIAAIDATPTPHKFNPSNGYVGDGVHHRVVPKSAAAGFITENSGTYGMPFTTARADLASNDGTGIPTNVMWPYRAVGKLFFFDGKDQYQCSAALIDRGVVATAAHCVAEYKQNRLFTNWRFIPGFRVDEREAPFGVWSVRKAYVLDSYPSGTEQCVDDAICQNDVAVLVLAPQLDAAKKPYLPGIHTGWFSFVSGKTPFVGNGITQVTQLGYPSCLDNGVLMQRNDSQGVISSDDNHNNTIIGSQMCGGSSGGPWIANFGIKPTQTGATAGQYPNPNVLIGVTSWGSKNPDVKRQGASPFLTTNIDALMTSACKEYPDACTYQVQ